MNCVHCLHMVLIIGKYTDIFRRRIFCEGGVFSTGRNFSLEGKFLGFNLPEEIFHGWDEGICQNSYTKFVSVVLFSL